MGKTGSDTSNFHARMNECRHLDFAVLTHVMLRQSRSIPCIPYLFISISFYVLHPEGVCGLHEPFNRGASPHPLGNMQEDRVQSPWYDKEDRAGTEETRVKKPSYPFPPPPTGSIRPISPPSATLPTPRKRRRRASQRGVCADAGWATPFPGVAARRSPLQPLQDVGSCHPAVVPGPATVVSALPDRRRLRSRH